MTVQHRPHVGFEVRCDAAGCSSTTAGTPQSTHSEAAAISAALAMLWVTVTIAGATYWVCPMQQTRDERLHRWVAQAGCVMPASRRRIA